ncbi:uncharacterized protein LOC143463545 [Clavelina lepadiformis]|uniref:uncharacterized protein LOC143463545 n=1 Tax=Clavelina lepadiformis TaxID=159417 RepID=UPI004042566C
MSAIHYKFSSSNEYKNITFDGLNVSLLDLKKAIMEKQKLKSTELDLHITNAQTLQVYKDEAALIPKNTAVLVRRVPLGPVRSSKVYVVKKNLSTAYTAVSSQKVTHENDVAPKMSLEELTKTSNLAEANASEEDKMKAAIVQSTSDYDPANFVRPPRYGSYKFPNQPSSSLPSHVRCYRCNQAGHYSPNCPQPKTEAVRQIHHATGIPGTQMVEVNKDAKGAMLSRDGKYVVPVLDKRGYEVGKKERPPFVPAPASVQEEEEEPIPDELICLLCKDLLIDAVVIPCCGNSYCDECIRNELLDSDSHQCPTCQKSGISPDSLIANKFLRQAVNKFRNDTGIVKRRSNTPVWPRPAPADPNKVKKVATPQMKVTYGPPQGKAIVDRKVIATGGYVVKAKSEQIAVKLAKRAPEGGSGSPRDPTQPIRIKFGLKDEKPEEVSQSVESTPRDGESAVVVSQPIAQSTPAVSETSGTPQSDVYTFNSTPDSGEQKPPANVSEPLPPGISPPVAKVVRPLMETSRSSTPTGEITTEQNLSGIQPLTQPSAEINETDEAKSGITPPNGESSEQLTTAAVSNLAVEVNEVGSESPITDPVPPPSTQNDSAPSLNGDVEDKELDEASIDINDTLNSSKPDVGNPPQVSSAPTPPLLIPPTQPPLNIPMSMPQPNIAVPPPNIVPSVTPITIPPPSILHVPPALVPPSLAGLPPPPVSSSALYQHPPPPFPFPFPMPPPGSSRFPPLGFPPIPSSLPPPGMSIPSLVKAPPSGLELPSQPPGTDGFSSVKASEFSERRLAGHDRPSPLDDKSPRRRSEKRSNKSKLDIMSDEFAQKLSKSRSSGHRRRRRGRSRSRSPSSRSSYSSSYSSGSRSSSYSSYSSRSWSSHSSRGRSRSAIRKRRRHQKRSKHSSRGRRRRSWSGSSRGRSDRSPSYSRKQNSKYKRGERSPRKKKRRDRKLSPRRRSQSYSRSPRRRPQPLQASRGRRGSPGLLWLPRQQEPIHPPTAFPSIPVIGSGDASIPGLPSKEAADFERDQALYAHYRQAYERDWYERGVMPPPPYDRFIQSRYSKSPSPPGTGPTSILGNPPFPPPPMLNPPQHPYNARFPPPPFINPGGRLPHERLLPHAPQPGMPPNDPFLNFPRAPDPAMRLSPRSQRRYDDDRRRNMDRPSRGHYRDDRGWDQRRRGNYDERGRKRGSNRGMSPDRSSRGSRRSRPASGPEQDGDGTPVRDERPPPEEVDLPQRKQPTTTRRAGDLPKVGKKPTRRENKSSRSKPQESSKSEKRETRKVKVRSESEKKDKTSSSQVTGKLPAKSTGDGKFDKQAVPLYNDSELPPSKEDKMEEIKESKLTDEPIPLKDSSKTPTIVKKETSKLSSPAHEETDDVPAVKDKNRVAPDDKGLDNKGTDLVKQEFQDFERMSQSDEVEFKSRKKSEESLSSPKASDAAKEKLPAKDKSASAVRSTKKGKSSRPAAAEISEKKEEEESDVVDVMRKPRASKNKARDANHEKMKWKPMASSSIVSYSTESPAESDDAPRREKSDGDEKKLIEYDGTGPPPTGDEMVKLTIPKSKWEDSEDETSQASSSRMVVKKAEEKPTKGRRIRIKRKPPPVNETVKSESAQLEVKNAPKMKAAEDNITDARMVITLRRNSKHDEDSTASAGRRVSLGNADEANFVPDYSGDEPTAPLRSPEKTVVAVKGKQVKVTAMRSSSQDSEGRSKEDVLSDLSEDHSSEKAAKKQSKKKKKKKKKHKLRQEEDVDKSPKEEESKKRANVSDDEKKRRKKSRKLEEEPIRSKRKLDEDEPRDRKRRRRSLEESRELTSSSSRKDYSRDKHNRDQVRHRHRDESADRRAKKRDLRRNSRSRERSHGDYHGKKQKKERKQKRRRHSRSSYTSHDDD